PDMETAFRKNDWANLRKRTIFNSFVGGLAYFLAIIGDYMIIGSEPMFNEIAVVRLSVLLVGLAVCACSIKFSGYTTRLNKIVCGFLLLLLLGESAELVIKAGLIEYVGIPGISVIVLLFYLSFPPHFIGILAVCLTGCGAFIITSALLGYASIYYIYTSLVFFLVINAFGAYVYLQFSAIRRREFCAIEELKRNAEIDNLTQVYNRRKALELSDSDIGDANNQGLKYSTVMIDVDNFKNVNDNYGHAVGDQVLIEVANRCREVLRKNDILGRFGGEEFIVFLPHTEMNTALIIADRLRAEVSDTAFKTNKCSLHITISLGVSTLTDAKETPEKLLEMADEALYTAKKTGKNKVCNCFEEKLGNAQLAYQAL
ncbi:MAG: GGDEF domain-containing protein, partial [Psychromonas sp.]